MQTYKFPLGIMPMSQNSKCVAISERLQSVIKHTDAKISIGRHFSIRRWVNCYFRQIEYLDENELQFLCRIFSDEGCWSGERLNNSFLGKKLTDEKVQEIPNPLRRYEYDMACRYCVIGKIQTLFQKQFEIYKSTIDPDDEDAYLSDVCIRCDLLDLMEDDDPILSFWIDKSSGILNEFSGIEGFRRAADLKWPEGMEYFYEHIEKIDRGKEILQAVTDLITSCAIHWNYGEAEASVFDFCFLKSNESAKNVLLLRLSIAEKEIDLLLEALTSFYFLDTAQDIVRRLCHEDFAAVLKKSISINGYALYFSSLSNIILENKELADQAKAIMFDLWKCERFSRHKKASIDYSTGSFPLGRTFASLIVDWVNETENTSRRTKEEFIIDILQFCKNCSSRDDFLTLKEDMSKNLRVIERAGMKKNVDYEKFTKNLFDKVLLGDLEIVKNPVHA